MTITVLNTPESHLGEGIFLDKSSMHLFWVDISNSRLFHYDITNKKLINIYELAHNPSCIFSVEENVLTYVDSEGIKEISILVKTSPTVKTHIPHNSKEFRANDGIALPGGNVIFGTMSFQPEEVAGEIYTLNAAGNEVIAHRLGIHIPNTFIAHKSRLYLSDSLKKRTYVVDLNRQGCPIKSTLTLWKDFSNFSYTPDGGCISEKGYLHIALWGGAAISVFDQNGNTMREIALPVLNPTNCVLLDSRWLFVTSAQEGMTEVQLNEYPLSGKTLFLDLGSDYEY
ncbi:SMP-30/gluconolactonase/LRE family protein [Vibrio sp. 10N.222.51.E8]|uniref:SMP-30/gluconolactonase/LRE family protein n=1 Tax=unclassified Vibrio TaxID=2614977 RepID=UPI0010BDBEEE|nr:SMP-30/gluconolactonase/LRE family protein [Vibrio sp. F13]TKG30315.1 SMP-30/gluconolactonase/LRE family protein [Vibrio sp. F13]